MDIWIRSYSELSKFSTFEERYEYLKLNGSVGKDIFGSRRFFNQQFYRSKEWRDIRNYVINRDCGMDLGVDGYPIAGKILIHHMNPITMQDIESLSFSLLEPENLICVSHNTHEAIHYGDQTLLVSLPVERMMNDTCPWRH